MLGTKGVEIMYLECPCDKCSREICKNNPNCTKGRDYMIFKIMEVFEKKNKRS